MANTKKADPGQSAEEDIIRDPSMVEGVNLHYLVPELKAPCTIYLFFKLKFIPAVKKGETVSLGLFEKIQREFFGSGFIKTEDLADWNEWKATRHPQTKHSHSTQNSDSKASQKSSQKGSSNRSRGAIQEYVNYALKNIEYSASTDSKLQQAEAAKKALQAAATNNVVDWFFKTPPDTAIFQHSARVTYLSLLFASTSFEWLPPGLLELLAVSSIIHELKGDPGEEKRGTSISMQTIELLEKSGNFIPQNIIEVIKQQDERFDGSGEPNKLKGSKILLEARIFAVTNTFDHVRLQFPGATRRVRTEKTRAQMQRESLKYDPEIFKLFWPFMEKTEIIG